MKKQVRVRFAPSPTGPLHIGGVRTALYNYIFAKQHQGTFILRIEDTDQNRLVPGAENYIREALGWCGVHPDEGVAEGGPFAPYRQSERKEIYAQYAQQLVETGHAYYAFDTEEDLEAMRERLKAAGVATPQYNAITRMQMKNSLTLDAGEVSVLRKAGQPYVIRLKVPRKEEVRVQDMIRGWVMVHSSTIDDKILLKSDGMPTYHLANVVDDYLMKITHVIRGEEWLPSAPLHVLLYRFLGWEEVMPRFAHLPLLLKPDGNGKLSKRDAEKHGFPIFPLAWQGNQGEALSGFREEGYLPEAFVNFLALLGWNPGTEQELFTLEELIQAFSIDRINKAGAKFDIQKAHWFNQQYIKNMPDEALADHLLPLLEKAGISSSREKAIRVCALMKERVTFLRELWENAPYFYRPPQHYDEKTVKKKWTAEAVAALNAYQQALQNASGTLKAEEASTLLHETLEAEGIKTGRIMQALRVAITGQSGGPDLMQIIEILGAAETVRYISKALHDLKDQVEQ